MRKAGHTLPARNGAANECLPIMYSARKIFVYTS